MSAAIKRKRRLSSNVRKPSLPTRELRPKCRSDNWMLCRQFSVSSSTTERSSYSCSLLRDWSCQAKKWMACHRMSCINSSLRRPCTCRVRWTCQEPWGKTKRSNHYGRLRVMSTLELPDLFCPGFVRQTFAASTSSQPRTSRPRSAHCHSSPSF